MPEPINYRAVLADLKAKRAALDIAIAALEPFAGEGHSTPANSWEDAPEVIRPDSFHNMSVPEATRRYFTMTGRQPKTPRDIAEALQLGGQGNANYTNVYTALKRLRATHEVTKLKNGAWGLADWYPPTRTRPSKEQIEARKEAPNSNGASGQAPGVADDDDDFPF